MVTAMTLRNTSLSSQGVKNPLRSHRQTGFAHFAQFAGGFGRSWNGSVFETAVHAAQIEVLLRRVSIGNFGDTKTVGDGVSELRIDVGGG